MGLCNRATVCAGQTAYNEFDWQLDFRYAPRDWQTAICLPDDWQKSLVAKDGSLLYDYPGHGLISDTSIAFEVSGQSWVTQTLVSPRIPIVRTIHRSGSLELLQEAFAVAPPIPSRKTSSTPIIERLGADHRMIGWARPPSGSDPAFANIALGRGEPIRYRFEAKAGEPYTVAFGLCEGYHKVAGERLLDLRIEGRTVRTVDVVKEKGPNSPAIYMFPAQDADGDGWITVAVAAAQNSPDKNTVLNTLWVFEGTDKPVADELLAGSSSVQPIVQLDCSFPSLLKNPARHDMIVMQMRNTAGQAITAHPVIRIKSEFPIHAEPSNTRATIGPATELILPEPILRVEKDGKTTILRFPSREIPGRKQVALALGVVRGQADPLDAKINLKDFSRIRERAEAYWTELKLPYDRLKVPDPAVQALLESSIRNIYQAREIKKGLPAFQVGPTRYRGLWVVDGAFLLEVVTFLGRYAEARSGIDYLMSFQKPNGSFMLIDGHFKETGIVLWAVTRHARLAGDKQWLRSVWPQLERGFAYIRQMRDMAPPGAPNARLVPDGYSDGGLSGRVPEYTNVYWTLAGVQAAIEAAHWLGLDAQAADWQREYDDFYETFRRAARRDMAKDAHGNDYLPIRMQSPEPVPPQKAQWAFLHAVFPGRIFDSEDPLVRGNMAMLQAVECEGLVLDTGWVKDGLWGYFGSFYAHAWLWLGEGEKAARTLYAFGNHASPLLIWREEQMPVGQGDKVVGDMPHNWASAEFIRLVRNSLILERGDELHLMEAMPRAWARPGSITNARDILTEFGPVSLECKVSRDGKSATVKFVPGNLQQRRGSVVTAGARRVLLHLDGWSGQTGTIELSPSRTTATKIAIR
jgi:hypothetical protein